MIGRVASAAAIGIAVAVAAWGLITHRAGAIPAAVLATAVIVPDALRTYESNILNARRIQRSYAAWNLLDALLRPAVVVAAVMLIAPTTFVALAATFAAVWASYALPRPWLAPRPVEPARDPAWSESTKARIRSFALPLVPFFALAWIIGLGDRFVIALHSGTAQAGIYAAAYGLASQGFLTLGTIGLGTFRPLFLSATDAGDARRARRVILAWAACLLAGSVVGIALLAALGTWLTDMLLGPAFAEAAPLLPWIGAAYAFQALQTMLEVLIYARHRTGHLLLVQGTGAVVAVVLYALLIPRWGMHGAALATLGSFVSSSGAAAVLGDLPGVLRAREVPR
jgi:O-antigen/teichoic acid export membrane protein